MNTSQKNTLLFGIALAGLGVMIGAFGAHALKDLLEQNQRLATFETAVKYQFYHALALILIGVLQFNIRHKFLGLAAKSMFVGVLIFSGSLYALCLTNIGILGAITPIGGLALISAWVLFFLAIFNQKTSK
jgi:uncharacterized membrane protein YgdD (TMEM256/DUF423 family)